MTLTKEQCNLLLNMVNACIVNAVNSGIPIGKEYYDDIEAIKEQLHAEMHRAILQEIGGSKS